MIWGYPHDSGNHHIRALGLRIRFADIPTAWLYLGWWPPVWPRFDTQIDQDLSRGHIAALFVPLMLNQWYNQVAEVDRSTDTIDKEIKNHQTDQDRKIEILKENKNKLINNDR